MNSSVGDIFAIDTAAAETVHAAIMQDQDTCPAVPNFDVQWPLSGLEDGLAGFRGWDSIMNGYARGNTIYACATGNLTHKHSTTFPVSVACSCFAPLCPSCSIKTIPLIQPTRIGFSW